MDEDGLPAINRKIYEIKKKIQLSEGQRKAQYEECLADKKRNGNKIRELKRDVKELHEKLGKPRDHSEAATGTTSRYTSAQNTLRSKSDLQAMDFFAGRAFDQRKRLDLLNHTEHWFDARLHAMSKEREELLKDVSLSHMRTRDKEAEERICSLENQIHLVQMNIMEAEHVRRKYRSIRAGLLEDGVRFQSSLDQLVQTIQTQGEETDSLNEVFREAVSLRDLTRGTLARHEDGAMQRGRNRDKQLTECRAVVEERKLELQQLERHIFPSGRPVLNPDSDSDSENLIGSEEAGNARKMAALEAAFTVLKEATGVTDYEEVLERFLSQKETNERLTYLKSIAEDEKKDLEKHLDLMNTKLEAFKFAETKDKEQNVEENERVKKWIEEQMQLRDKYLSETERIESQLGHIGAIVCDFIKRLGFVDDSATPGEIGDGIVDMLEALKRKISHMMLLEDHEEAPDDRQPASDQIKVDKKCVEPQLPEEVWAFPPSGAEGGAVGEAGPPESDDEQDVPTRGFLKRQAQIIIDAKSRRKQFTLPRRAKSAFGPK